MDLDEFIAQFAEQLDTTDAGSISADTEFKNLDDWTSMTALAVIAMVDAEYGIQIKSEDLSRNATIADLFACVKALKG